MDSRTAAHALSQIAAYLELSGANSFKSRAYAGAARGLLALGADDLAPLLRSGELANVRGLGPATLSVVRDLVESGESRYLEQLRLATPEGLLEMLDVPGLSPARIHQIHETLNISTLEELEAAALDGRLATLPKLGAKTAMKILHGVAAARARGSLRRYPHAALEARPLLAAVQSHPDVEQAELAGEIRRHLDVVGSVDIAAACTGDPAAVAQSFTRLPGVKSASGTGARVEIQFVDGAKLTLWGTSPTAFGVVLWQLTGSAAHVTQIAERLRTFGITTDGDILRDRTGAPIPTPREADVYAAAKLPVVPPELREGTSEVAAAAAGSLPSLLELADIRGVLHCHTTDSDGKATVAEMANAARARGWRYIGITDHSQAAFYAGGLKPDAVLEQHDEIDALNAAFTDFRILKGIEADILANGQLDDDDDLLDRVDFVIGSIHSRFSMDRASMTERVLRAMENPRLTILAHPTGRLLLSREPYAIDLDAVLETAARNGVAVELNADPHRLDLDWRYLHQAKTLGVTIEIGPDAHSTNGLDNVQIGVGMARKGWLERDDVLNARSADDVIAFARARRTPH